MPPMAIPPIMRGELQRGREDGALTMATEMVSPAYHLR